MSTVQPPTAHSPKLEVNNGLQHLQPLNSKQIWGGRDPTAFPQEGSPCSFWWH